MNQSRILAPSFLALALASCATHKNANSYDTPNPYGAADPSAVNAPPTEPANPIYDTPAAYEESTPATPPVGQSPAVSPSANPNMPAPKAPRVPSNGAAIIHTVVAGDTLSGISAKYHVPAATIKQANNMTKDTVVLGRKMVIPPVH